MSFAAQTMGYLMLLELKTRKTLRMAMKTIKITMVQRTRLTSESHVKDTYFQAESSFK